MPNTSWVATANNVLWYYWLSICFHAFDEVCNSILLFPAQSCFTTQSDSPIHTLMQELQYGVQYLAQGHFTIQIGGAGIQTSDLPVFQTTHSTSWATAAQVFGLLTDKTCKKLTAPVCVGFTVVSHWSYHQISGYIVFILQICGLVS